MKYRINKNISSEKLGDTLIILNHDTGKYIEINEVGSMILNNIEKISENELSKKISVDFKISENQAYQDIKHFIDDCLINLILVKIDSNVKKL